MPSSTPHAAHVHSCSMLMLHWSCRGEEPSPAHSTPPPSQNARADGQSARRAPGRARAVAACRARRRELHRPPLVLARARGERPRRRRRVRRARAQRQRRQRNEAGRGERAASIQGRRRSDGTRLGSGRASESSVATQLASSRDSAGDAHPRHGLLCHALSPRAQLLRLVPRSGFAAPLKRPRSTRLHARRGERWRRLSRPHIEGRGGSCTPPRPRSRCRPARRRPRPGSLPRRAGRAADRRHGPARRQLRDVGRGPAATRMASQTPLATRCAGCRASAPR